MSEPADATQNPTATPIDLATPAPIDPATAATAAPARPSSRRARATRRTARPPTTPTQRRRAVLWLGCAAVVLAAVPAFVLTSLYREGATARARIAELDRTQGYVQEQVESALLADWERVGNAVNAAALAPETAPASRARCLEMLLMHHGNEKVALLTAQQREVRLGLGYGDFLSQERAEDGFLQGWGVYSRAVAQMSGDRTLPDRVRLRCREMMELQSNLPAAAALAHFSRATRCYRAAGYARDPGARDDAAAAFIGDDPDQYQTPDRMTPIGTPAAEAFRRARDEFWQAQDQYEDLADHSTGQEQENAADRARRASRLYLACIKFMPMDDIYRQYKAEQEKKAHQQAIAPPANGAPPAPRPVSDPAPVKLNPGEPDGPTEPPAPPAPAPPAASVPAEPFPVAP